MTSAMAGIMSAMGEIFQLEHPETGGHQQGASAGLEIPDHVRGAEGQQDIGQGKQGQEDHQLGQGDEADDDPQFAGEKVQQWAGP